MKFHIKGTACVRVTTTERIRIDEIIEAEDADDAEMKALDMAEDEADSFGDDCDSEWDSDPIIDEIPIGKDEWEDHERAITYRAMVAMNAPRLPGMEVPS